MQGFALKRLLVLTLVLLTAACGFRLRSMESLPFESIYVQGGALSMVRDIQRQLIGSGVKVVNDAEDAQAQLEVMSEAYEKRILSLSGNGRVREFLLVYHATFRVKSGTDTLWGAPQTVELQRDYSYDDTALLAAGAEEQRLNDDMHNEAVHEILRRVGSLSKQAARAK